MGGKPTQRRLSIAVKARAVKAGAAQAVVVLGLLLSACTHDQGLQTAAAIPRPPPDDPTPTGIVYICEGRKQVTVVYARLRATITHEGRTWRLEYQQSETGFRYFDAQHEWVGTDSLAVLRTTGQRIPLAFNCRPSARA